MEDKKKSLILLIVGIIGILIIVISVTHAYFQDTNGKENKDNNLISVMIEITEGNYEQSPNNSWPDDNYELNEKLSTCENGGTVSYDKTTKSITMNTNNSDKCSLYFNIIGTKTNPIKIENIEDLVDLSNEVNAGNSYAGKYFVLTRDLDFQNPGDYENSERMDYKDYNGDKKTESLIKELTSGRGFLRIGNPSGAFEGNFNGQYNGTNHRIDNLRIVGGGWPAFFGAVKNATISNLTVNGNVTSSGTTPMGGLINYLENSTIENTISEINVTNNFNSYVSGGLVGFVSGNENSEAKIINCVNKGNISGGGQTAGFVAHHQVGKLTIENSINEGTISNNYGDIIGGIVGFISNQLQTEIKPTLIIKNSNNKGKIISNVSTEQNLHMGGLIGYINTIGSAIIDNSYNIGDVINERTEYSTLYYANLGGLVGYINSTETKISNSYNLGMVENGNRIGGLLGSNRRCKNIIISNSYNNGNIKTNITGKAFDLIIGGLIGYNQADDTVENNKTIVLNSYNSGDINAKQIDGASGTYGRIYSSGIIGLINHGGNVKIINAYNIGNIIDTSNNANVANGIAYIYGSYPYIFNLNNVYNLGYMQATTNYEIGFIANNTTKTINNVYYNSKNVASNQSDKNMVGMTDANMKNESFVTILNNNINNIKLSEIDPLLDGYTLSNWKLGVDNYPTLINE